jgi:hypothetical protein
MIANLLERSSKVTMNETEGETRTPFFDLAAVPVGWQRHLDESNNS